MFVTVVLPDRRRGLNDGLTYRGIEGIEAGTLVRVAVRNRRADGIVIETATTSPLEAAKLKTVERILSHHPLLPPYLLRTAQWMTTTYVTSLRTVLGHMLPTPPWTTFLPPTERWYQLAKNEPVRGPQQKRILEALTAGEESETRLMERTQASSASITTLLKRGLITVQKRETRTEDHSSFQSRLIDLPAAWRTISAELQSAQASLLVHAEEPERVDLYAQIAGDLLAKKKGMIVLVPEHARARTMHDALVRHLGQEHVFLYEPGMPRAREAEMRRLLAHGMPRVIVGTRSALFVPCTNLGCVLIDDEHDWLFKSERTPTYHARDVAKVMAKEAGAQLILASSCPSLESWHAATVQGTMKLVNLPRVTPERPVTIVNLRDVQFGTSYPLSAVSVLALQAAMKAGDQAVVFLNHRGEATGFVCTECKHLLELKHDGRQLTMHMDNMKRPVLRDHVTGKTFPVPERCPACGALALRSVGAGTQAVERLLRKFAPNARIARFDRDAVEGGARHALFSAWHAGQYDIAIGTQSVLPALTSSRVSCAVALIADVGLSLPHIRAGERLLQLLCTMRSVLHRKNGTCIVQTFHPDAREMQALKEQNVTDYLNTELSLRKTINAPPWARTATLIVRHVDAQKQAAHIAAALASFDPTLTVQTTPSQRGIHEWYVHVSGEHTMSAITSVKKSADFSVDVEPLYRF